MDIELLRTLCNKLPHVREDVKWGNDLCFCIGGKMFCVAGLDRQPTSASFKVRDEEFEDMCSRPGFSPAPYVARYKWVLADDLNRMTAKEWEHFVTQSYELVVSRLPSKVKKQFGLP